MNEVQLVKFKKQAREYLQKLVISPDEKRLAIPSIQKLSFLSITPKGFIKERPIGKDKNGNVVKAPYIPIDYVERSLNFVSNRNRGFDIVEHELTTGGKSNEAMVKLSCRIYLDEKRVERTVIGSARQYSNPATTKYDCIKSAVSNGLKIFAKGLGIGADKSSEYKGKVGEVRANLMKSERDDITEGFTALPPKEKNDDNTAN